MPGWIFGALVNPTTYPIPLATPLFTVKEVVEGQSQNLLESVAQMIASKIFTNHPQISAVRVQVGKPHVAVPGSLDYLGVEIIRYRSIDAPN
ncbi:hypothetical protein V6N12_053329 [Hibiscus sabdariffa]|uniref:dihydroneopterin aldolase n=1 Tax=Hibiscus sabdariffa TaxID=183260 RepID=A0ABR2D785_9ROSI